MISIKAEVEKKSLDFSFSPRDFENVLSIEDLTEYFTKIILDIRNSSSIEYQTIIKKIEELEEFNNQYFNKKSSLKRLLEAYKKIIKVSMELRKLLSNFIPSLDLYDDISYAFYYNGQRYYIEDLDISWLRKTSAGTLKINLNKATKDIESELKKRADYETIQKIRELINNHYQLYLMALIGMNEAATNRASNLNRGHIAEAFEGHLIEDHREIYNKINLIYNNKISTSELIAYSQDIQNHFNKNYNRWSDHEDPDSAWRHYRAAKGTQRGTVAGDVGRTQVKQAQNENAGQLKLTSLANLKRGISTFSDIINPNIDVNSLAKKLAIYMSERVSKPTQEMIANRLNEEFTKFYHI